MKYTVSEFAREIRKLYPSHYDDLTDNKLVELWLRKYPNDKSKIEYVNQVSSNIKTAPNTYSSSESKPSYSGLIVLIVLGVFLAITNPDESTHVREASKVFKHMLNKNLNNSESGLVSMFGGALIDGLSGYVISRNNYIFFSTTKVSILGKEQIIGFGILGKVFISDNVEK